MKGPGPFTLVYQPGAPNRVRLNDALEHIRSHKMRLLGGNFGRVLALQALDLSESIPNVAHYTTVVDDLLRQRKVVRIGIWDLGAAVGFLPDVIEAMNRAQPALTMFQVHAAVPLGLRHSAEGMEGWLRHLGIRVTRQRRDEIHANFLADDFFPHADRVRRALALDYLVGVTPLMVAGNKPAPYWNYFASSSDRTILVSTYDLPRFAKSARRPFETAVAMLVVSLVLEALNPRIGQHYETRACIFDFNEDRESIVQSLRAIDIDPQCRALLRPAFVEPALLITKALREYVTPSRGAVTLPRGRTLKSVSPSPVGAES